MSSDFYLKMTFFTKSSEKIMNSKRVKAFFNDYDYECTTITSQHKKKEFLKTCYSNTLITSSIYASFSQVVWSLTMRLSIQTFLVLAHNKFYKIKVTVCLPDHSQLHEVPNYQSLQC